MVDLKRRLAILAAKLVNFFLGFSCSGGTAAPGLIALKIDPQLLTKLHKQLKFSIIISGTNGKTTTARILASILRSAKIPYYHNRTGSNLLRGIVSELSKHVRLNGSLKKKVGLWEIDEAALPLAVKALRPKIIILTNLFRDQLDRYGEVDTLAQKWAQALGQLPPQSIVILNADDPLVASLGSKTKNRVLYYGLRDKRLGSARPAHASDATFCPSCLKPLNYQTCFVSHQGIYQCSKCGQIQPRLDYRGQQTELLKNSLKLKINKTQLIIKLTGIYNLYNSLAAFSLARSLGIKGEKIKQGFKNFRPAFGRFEKIPLNNNHQELRLMLAKNPTGFNQVLKTINQMAGSHSLSCLLALNDRIADGQDVSWIWDVDFNLLKKLRIDKLIVSGTRADDLALRLKYAEINYQSTTQTVRNLNKALNTLIKQRNKKMFIIPTYTAMLDIRKILSKMNLIHSTWED